MVCELNQQNPPTDQEVYVRFVRRVAGSYSSTVISERLRVKRKQQSKYGICVFFFAKCVKKSTIKNCAVDLVHSVELFIV